MPTCKAGAAKWAGIVTLPDFINDSYISRTKYNKAEMEPGLRVTGHRVSDFGRFGSGHGSVCQIWCLHQIRFRLGLRPRPRWRSSHRSPRPLAGFKGSYFEGKGREMKGKERRGWRGEKGREEKGKGRKGRGGQRRGGKGRERTTLRTPVANSWLRHC